jgi:hypothetical protein
MDIPEVPTGGGTHGRGNREQVQGLNPIAELSSGACPPSVNSSDGGQQHLEASGSKKGDRGTINKPPTKKKQQGGLAPGSVTTGNQSIEKAQIIQALNPDPTINELWAEHLAKQMDAAFTTIQSAEFRSEVDAHMLNKLREVEQRRGMNMPPDGFGVHPLHGQDGLQGLETQGLQERSTAASQSSLTGLPATYSYLKNMDMAGTYSHEGSVNGYNDVGSPDFHGS